MAVDRQKGGTVPKWRIFLCHNGLRAILRVCTGLMGTYIDTTHMHTHKYINMVLLHPYIYYIETHPLYVCTCECVGRYGVAPRHPGGDLTAYPYTSTLKPTHACTHVHTHILALTYKHPSTHSHPSMHTYFPYVYEH